MTSYVWLMPKYHGAWPLKLPVLKKGMFKNMNVQCSWLAWNISRHPPIRLETFKKILCILSHPDINIIYILYIHIYISFSKHIYHIYIYITVFKYMIYAYLQFIQIWRRDVKYSELVRATPEVTHEQRKVVAGICFRHQSVGHESYGRNCRARLRSFVLCVFLVGSENMKSITKCRNSIVQPGTINIMISK